MKYLNRNIDLYLVRNSLIIILVLFGTVKLNAEPEIPNLTTYVTDLTGTLSNLEVNKLNMELRKFDDITSTQVVFLMIPTLDGYPLEMYANEVAEKNKIGTKENDNGVLFLVVKNDRKMRIEVGYGLEGVLPDALASSIIRNDVAPYFKKNNYYSGIVAGLSSIIAATRGEYTNTRRNRNRKDDEEFGFPWGFIIFIIIFMVFGRNRGGLGTLLLLNALGGSGRSSGGFGGGGFGGGFSGGGGGFGGGGASGGW